MKITPHLEDYFYHDGRGPELQNVVWARNGVVLVGFEYFNPDDEYSESNIKNLKLLNVEAFAMSSDEVHGGIVANGNTRAAIHEIRESQWKRTFQQIHLESCKHYQIMFYDEIYDVLCEDIAQSSGKLIFD